MNAVLDNLPLVSALRTQMRAIFAGRRWLVGTPALVAAANIGQTLVELGAEKVLAIGCNRGTGALPTDDRIALLDLNISDLKPGSPGLRDADALLEVLDPSAQRQVEAFDPDGSARAIGALFSDGRPIAGRAAFGARPKAWRDLEDKTIVDAFWDAAGITRAPFSVVAACPADLLEASQALDAGHGTVWAGDNREGWHGGAHLLRWVRGSREAQEACDFLATHCDTVRVMPFLEGTPCSIHGWVLPETTMALRPCEMLVLRIPGSATLSYAGAATSWQPAEPLYSQMRAVARQAGAHLRTTVGYRGSFTVDGVATRQGFLPTELNPRYGGAISRMARRLPEVPLYLLHLISAEGLPFAYQGDQLESLIVQVAKQNPVVRALQTLPGRFDIEPRTQDVLLGEDQTWRPCPPGTKRSGVLSIGSGPAGGIVFFDAAPDALPSGPSAAPHVCQALALADTIWDLDLGPRMPAPEMVPHA